MRGGRSSRRHCRCRSPSAPRGVPDRFQLVYSRRTRLIPITPRNSLIPTRPVPALLWVDDTDDKSIASAAGPLRLRSTCSYRHARSAGLSQRTPRPRPAERDACNPLCINPTVGFRTFHSGPDCYGSKCPTGGLTHLPGSAGHPPLGRDVAPASAATPSARTRADS